MADVLPKIRSAAANTKQVFAVNNMRASTFTITRRTSPTNVSLTTYAIGTIIGSGMNAICRECLEGPLRVLRAVKIVTHNGVAKKKTQFKREVRILGMLHHPNIVNLIGHHLDDKLGYLVLKLCNGGSLADRIKQSHPITEVEASGCIRQLLEAVAHMHSLNIIHRDIKPANILFHDGQVKLVDFGYAIVNQRNELQRRFVGTPNFIAPEILKRRGYSFSVDVWAIGITAYSMLHGRPPYQTASVEKTYSLIRSGVPVVLASTVSELAKSFISEALVRDVAKRKTAEQLLSHPFLYIK